MPTSCLQWLYTWICNRKRSDRANSVVLLPMRTLMIKLVTGMIYQEFSQQINIKLREACPKCPKLKIALIIFSHFYHSIHTIVRHRNSLLCADVPLINYSLSHSLCPKCTDIGGDKSLLRALNYVVLVFQYAASFRNQIPLKAIFALPPLQEGVRKWPLRGGMEKFLKSILRQIMHVSRACFRLVASWSFWSLTASKATTV